MLPSRSFVSRSCVDGAWPPCSFKVSLRSWQCRGGRVLGGPRGPHSLQSPERGRGQLCTRQNRRPQRAGAHRQKLQPGAACTPGRWVAMASESKARRAAGWGWLRDPNSMSQICTPTVDRSSGQYRAHSHVSTGLGDKTLCHLGREFSLFCLSHR